MSGRKNKIAGYPTPTPEEIAGLLARAVNNPKSGEAATAKKNLWRMPEEKAVINKFEIKVPAAAMDNIRLGHMDKMMEDHWYMYCDDSTIRYYRSWTGICAYEAQYVKDGEDYRITEVAVNRNPDQYRGTDDDYDFNMFIGLLIGDAGVGNLDFLFKYTL